MINGRPAFVPDTNVLVSAYLQITQGNWESPSVELVRSVVDGKIDLFTSVPLLFELASTLQKPRLQQKYGISDSDAVEWMYTIGISAFDIVEIRGLDFGCRDPRDSKVIETAYNAPVQYVVARDQDLKEPTVHHILAKRNIEVVNVGEMIRLTLTAD